jgi:hypothetical protein
LIQASSMAVTSQCKIALRPRSVFCFGTISSVADEKGILHRIADPPEKKLSSERDSRKRNLLRLKRRLPLASREPRIHSPEEPRCPLLPQRSGHTYKEKRSKRDGGPSSYSSNTFALKGRKGIHHHNISFLPRRPLHRGESGVFSHVRRRANHARRKTSPAGSSTMEEQTPEYSATSRGWGTGPSAARIPG